ncbi:hypothetical protein ACX0HA_12110 [Flavobacterium hauense]
MTKKILLLLLCISPLSAIAQDTISKSIISLGLLSSTFSQAPRWDIGYIHKIDKRIWVGMEIGYGNYDMVFHGSSGDENNEKDYQLFEIRPSVYYDLRPTGKLKHIPSIELYYIHHTDTYYTDWYHDNDVPMWYRYQQADYKRQKYGLNVNYNLLYNFGKHFSLMQTIGVGIKIRDVKYTNVTGKEEAPNHEESDVFFATTNYIVETGTNVGFNFNMDLKLLYKF